MLGISPRWPLAGHMDLVRLFCPFSHMCVLAMYLGLFLFIKLYTQLTIITLYKALLHFPGFLPFGRRLDPTRLKVRMLRASINTSAFARYRQTWSNPLFTFKAAGTAVSPLRISLYSLLPPSQQRWASAGLLSAHGRKIYPKQVKQA